MEASNLFWGVYALIALGLLLLAALVRRLWLLLKRWRIRRRQRAFYQAYQARFGRDRPPDRPN